MRKRVWQKLKFKKIPTCEECGREPATSFSFFSDPLEEIRIGALKKMKSKGHRTVTIKELMDSPQERFEVMALEAKGYVPKKLCKLTGDCTSKTEEYYVLFEEFFKSPTDTIKWLVHLSKRGWVDWDDFMKAVERLKKMVR